MKKIEKLFDSENDSAIEDGITGIENEAMEKLSGDDLDNVMYYAEAAKGGISYWSEVDNSGERSVWSKIKKHIKKIAISAGLGAVVGIATGFLINSATGNPAAAISAGIVTGIYSSLASAYKAYNTGKISIVIIPK